MENAELIKALKEDAESANADYSTPITLGDHLDAAADALESLQAQIAASQREKRAAVKDIEKMMRICEKGACHFCADGDCAHSPYCSPKWRGPVAGEGERDV